MSRGEWGTFHIDTRGCNLKIGPVENGLGHHLSKEEWKQEWIWLDEGRESETQSIKCHSHQGVGIESQTSRDGNRVGTGWLNI